MTKFRKGLYPLEPFTKEDAKAVLEQIHRWQKIMYERYGIHFIHASDEWYILAGEELPEEDRYDGYLQLENGVGMLRLLDTEVRQAVAERDGNDRKLSGHRCDRKTCSSLYSRMYGCDQGKISEHHIRGNCNQK